MVLIIIDFFVFVLFVNIVKFFLNEIESLLIIVKFLMDNLVNNLFYLFL